MQSNRDQISKDQSQTDHSSKKNEKQRSSAFKETSLCEESITNIKEEASQKQERNIP